MDDNTGRDGDHTPPPAPQIVWERGSCGLAVRVASRAIA